MSAMTGLLILTQPVRKIIPNLSKTLKAASKHVSKKLYIHLDPLARFKAAELPQRISLYSRIITTIYSESSAQCQGMDVRILMTGFKHMSEVPQQLGSNIDLVLLDQARDTSELAVLKQRYNNYLQGNDEKLVYLCAQEERETNDAENETIQVGGSGVANDVFDSVVVGGTFDHIHAGHKILLSEGLLRCSRKFTAGIADGPLVERKILFELMASCQKRIDNVKELLTDLDPTLNYNIVQISEPLGPTSWDPDMDMIVVSEETRAGIEKINNKRREANLKSLEGHVISLVEDKIRNADVEEEKVSSSSQRMRLLGTLINPVVPNPSIPSHPYIIGLTGGSASGKSNIAKYLEELGAGIVDCDKLGHKAYKKDTDCYKNLIGEFGNDIVGADGEIDRKKLGPKVFSNSENLTKLNNIVWPEIAKLAKEEILELEKKGCSVVVLDAAVLLKANWQVFCHQVWVSIVNKEEAIRRIMERDGKSRQEAENRLASQLSNKEMVAQSNVVFCSQWKKEYTRQQVDKAWGMLQEILSEQNENCKSQL